MQKKLTGYDKNSVNLPDPIFTTDEDLAKNALKTFMTKYKDIPVSSLSIWNEGDGEVALTVMTREGYQGKGYASAAMNLGMKWIEDNKDIMTAYWDVRLDNTSSINLAKKYGFRKMPGTNKKRSEWTTYRKKYKR